MTNNQFKRAAHFGIHWLIVPAIAVIMTLWPTFSSGLEQLQTDPGDTLLNLYFLEHAYQHFSGLNLLTPDQYWSPNFFWPIRDTLSWSDHLLGPSVIYGAFRLLVNPYQSYVAWLSLTLALNYISIRLATQRIASTTSATWLSIIAVATTFSPVIIQQMGHPQLLSLFLVGPILVLCHCLINEPTIDFTASDWLSLAAWILAIGFFNIYICVYAFYGTLICVFIHFYRRLRAKRLSIRPGLNLKANIVILTSIISANSIIYWPYLQTLKIFGKRPVDEILNNLPKPLSYLYSSDYWLIKAPWTSDNPPISFVYGAEQQLFPGWILLILITAAVITAFRKRQTLNNGLQSWLYVVAAMVLFSLSWREISAWPLISKLLPGASSLRASSRVGMMVILFSSPALALSSRHWQLQITQTKTTLAGVLAMIGTFSGIWATGQPSFSLKQWRIELDSLSSSLNNSKCSVFWYQWSNQPPWRAQVIAMHAQQLTGIPTANGYSGQFPRELWPFTNSSGHSAFQWIDRATYQEHHKTRDRTDSSGWCVATLNQNGKVSLRSPEEFIAVTTKRVSRNVYSNDQFSIGSKDNQLYIKAKNKLNSSQWVLILRNNLPIRSDRGDYKITAIDKAKPNDNSDSTILITDRNIKQHIKYIWTVNSETGEFISQTMAPIFNK